MRDERERGLARRVACATVGPWDNRLIGNLGEAKRLKSEDPSRIVGVGGCWSQSLKEKVFERFPFVDVAFGPGQIDGLAQFLQSDDLGAQGYFEFEGFPAHLPPKRERRFQAWVQISVGCNCVCSYCIVPSTRGRERSRPPAEILREVEVLAADGVREVTLLGQNVNSYGRDLRGSDSARVRRVAGVRRRGRRDRADPLHEPPPEGHAPRGDRRARRAAEPLRAHPPAAPERLQPHPQVDAPHLRPRPLHAARGDDPRACARLRDHDRHHRRLPRRDRGDFAETLAVVDEVGYDSAFTFIFSPRRGTEAADSPDQLPHAVKRERMERLVELVQRRAQERSNRFVDTTQEVLVEGPSRTDPARLRGRTRHNKTVNFTGLGQPGELVDVDITGATSTTLAGEQNLLAHVA